MEEWKEYKIEETSIEMIDGDRGKNYPKNHDFFTEGYCLFLNAGNVTKNGFSFSENSFITREKDNALRKGRLERYDVVITTRGTVGNIALYDMNVPFEHIRINSGMLILKSGKDILPEYLYYYLKGITFQTQINQYVSGSAQPQLPKGTLAKMCISYPLNKDTQKRIIAILKSLDDKIEVNRRINENLEQQAQALFKSWFVDFEPFKNGEFVESELGMIPKGWRVEFFKEVCNNITDGVHNSVKDDINGNYYLLSCKNIKGGVITIGENERKVNKETFEKLRKRTRLQKGDLLLSSVGTIGEMVLLNEIPSNYEFQRSVAIIKPNKEIISSHFLYYAMKAQKDEIIHSAHGAVQQCLFISDVANFKTIVPLREVMQHFTNIAVELHEKISKNNQESRRLAELRDTLLPKLMSGEFKVNEIVR